MTNEGIHSEEVPLENLSAEELEKLRAGSAAWNNDGEDAATKAFEADLTNKGDKRKRLN